VTRNNRLPTFAKLLSPFSSGVILGFTVLLALAGSALLVRAGDTPSHIPSNVSWTPEKIAAASSGDAFQGMLLARQCEHCHGAEGFSPKTAIPNLAGLDKLAVWKQLEDFRSHKRLSPAMVPIAESLSPRDVADVVAYYSRLPIFPDPQDNRIFPGARPDAQHATAASHIVSFGDGERGIPPCQACHGPVAYRPGAPSLATQNTDYVLDQLEAFAEHTRANDINEPMRTIAGLLTEDERHALAEYYGAGLGQQPSTSK
jgi:cytochrome c553